MIAREPLEALRPQDRHVRARSVETYDLEHEVVDMTVAEEMREVVDALLAQHGMVQVPTLDDLLETTTLMAFGKDKPAGRRIGTLSGSGGEIGWTAALMR